jgi:pyruvate,water dikinase
MSSYVLGFQDIDKTKLMVVGGKGANLGELCKIEGIRVPDGFCIATEAYKSLVVNFAALSKRSPSPQTLLKRSLAFSPNLEKKMPMQCGPAQPQRICRLPPLQVSRILI